MSGKTLRIALFLSPALALAACGQSNDQELARQLAEAKATAAQEAAARQAAEREAASLRARDHNSPDLQSFYAGNSGGEDSTMPQDQSGDIPNDQPVNDAPEASAPDMGAPQPAQAGA